MLPSVDGNTRVAVLSLMDPTFIAASNPDVAAMTLTDYEQAIDVELAALRRDQKSPAIVVAMVWGIPTTAAEELAAGGASAAKAQAVETLIEKTIGVDVYILSSFTTDPRAGNGTSYTTQNWAGDDVLVVSLTKDHDLGKAVEVVQATFNDKGLLVKTLSGSHAVALTCAVPESAAARAFVDGAESKRQATMLKPVGTLKDAVDGSEIHDGSCVSLGAGTKKGKCGCRVSQCQAGSLVADAMQHATGADFAVVNGGGIDASLPKDGITQENVHNMLPYLDDVIVVENVKGATVREMLANSVSELNAPDVTTNPHGRYLQVSKGLQFEWYVEGAQTVLGAINVCRQGAKVTCADLADFAPLDDAATYSIATPGFIAAGGDDYSMLENEVHVSTHTTQYEVVVEYFAVLNGGNPDVVTDALQIHNSAPSSANCADAGGVRVCQTLDVVQIPIGLYCVGDGLSSLQECDQAHHMASVINNKHDGFMDDLLPHARLVLNENHVYTGCSADRAVSASVEMNKEAETATGEAGGRFVATIGPGCSSDVEDVTGKQWRDENGNHNLVISGSSTSVTLDDDAAFPNLARMSTSEFGIGKGFASLARIYGWNRIAIVHDSSNWGTDSAKQFEAAMLADSVFENELIYLDFGGTLDRTACEPEDAADPDAKARITDAKEGCDPLTSFSIKKVTNAYPGGEGDCDPTNSTHFCVTEVIKQLKEVDAKIIFIAAQRETQRALFREIYKNRENADMAIHGEGYAYMSALVDESLFVRPIGGIDYDALEGAMGALGIQEAVDENSTTFKTYTSLWGEAGSQEACCQQGGAEDTGTLLHECKRASPSDVTVRGEQEHTFCDTDGDGATAPGYAFSIADGVLTLARALHHNDLYRQANDSSKLYDSLLAYHAESTDEQVSGITGSIRFEKKSGDRNGDFQIVNLQTVTVGVGGGSDGDSGAGRHRKRRVVELDKTQAVFATIGYLRVQQGSDTRVLLDAEEGAGKASTLGTFFPGGLEAAPSDDAEPVDPLSIDIVKVVVPIVVVFLLIFIGFAIVHRRTVGALKEEVTKLGKTLVGVRHVTSGVNYGSMGIDAPVAGVDSYIAVGSSEGAAEETVKPDNTFRWYWQEGADRMDSHNKFDILQPGNWVSYAWGVCSELDDKYDQWHAKKGATRIQVDLTDRIASTGNEAKAHGQDSGANFEIDFEHMTQKNLKSKFIRPIQRVKIKAAVANPSFLQSTTPQTPHGSAVPITKISTGLPADLAASLDFKLLLVKPGQLVQQSTVRDDGWAFGSVLFDPTTGDKAAGAGGPPMRKTSTNISYDVESGWFPLSCTELANATHLAKLQAKMGSGASDMLAAPAHWDSVRDPLIAERIRLNDGPEKTDAVNAFKQSLSANVTIVSVDRIQNMAMFQSYAVKRQGMLTRDKGTAMANPEKIWLFHGTSAETVPKIIQQGFNRGFAGKNATVYGKGVYFAKNSSYSASTTYSPPSNGVQQMFLCRVLTGHTCKGVRDQLVPDVRDSARNILYDCTTNSDSTIFVTYHDSQQYPDYLIRFK